MGKLGTIFGIVAAVLAIVAAGLSFMISGKRVLYEDRAAKLATTVVQVVDKLDQNSNSGAKAAVSFTVAEGQRNGTPEDSLGWKKFLDDPAAFDASLGQAVTLSDKINTQRDTLAKSLADASTGLGMDLDVKELRDLGNDTGVGTAVASIAGHVEAVAARDKAMADALVKAAGTINHSLDAAVLSKREESTDADGKVVKGQFPCVAPLEDFNGKVKGLSTRANDYADAIVAAIRGVSKHTWQADPEKVKDEREYSGALTSLQNDFTDINEQLALYEQAKKEVAEQKTRISQLMEGVEEAQAELRDVKKDLTKVKSENLRLKKIANIDEGAADGPSQDLAGEVVEVNEQWNFVVLNLGRKDRVPENLRMLVARGDKLVARLLVSKVMGKVSVAEILPEANVEAVKVGDRVIMPKEQEE
jgi:hypothetical protein